MVRQAGLPHSTFHGLRHCHASLLLADGVNIKAISERLGHSNVAITLNIYSHLLPNIQEEAADGIDRQLAPRERWSQNGHQPPVTVQAESY